VEQNPLAAYLLRQVPTAKSGGSIFARSNLLSRSSPLTSRSWTRMGLTAPPWSGLAPCQSV